MRFRRAQRLEKSATVKYSYRGWKKRSGSAMRSEAKARSEIDHVLTPLRSSSRYSPNKENGRTGYAAISAGTAVRSPTGADTQAVRERSQRAGNAPAIV